MDIALVFDDLLELAINYLLISTKGIV